MPNNMFIDRVAIVTDAGKGWSPSPVPPHLLVQFYQSIEV